MHLEFLVEDSSGAALLRHLVPRIIGDEHSPHTWRIHAYKGIGKLPKNLTGGQASNRILLDQLPRLLQGYAKTSGVDAVIVVLDTDRNDCRAFLQELKQLEERCNPRPNVLFRLAIEEIEAWYFGDPAAVNAAYPRAKQNFLNSYSQDSVCGTWEMLADAIYKGGSAAIRKAGWPLSGELKHEWARQIGALMNVENNLSPSFCKFRDGLRRLVR